MRVKDISNLRDKLRPYLKEYLEYTGTKFSGAHFTCPNKEQHKNDDNKPSASFYPDPNSFHCFSCDMSGDIFTAAHYLEDKPLTKGGFITDNVLYLAELFKEEYSLEDMTEEDKKRDKLLNIMQCINTMLCTSLIENINDNKLKQVKQLIISRGWGKVVKDFEFGYCNYDVLVSLLKNNGYDIAALQEVGILPLDETKNYETFLFNDRLLFPIKSHYGKVIAFGSRLIGKPKTDKEQKYLQSRNTVLYTKKNVLFNLNRARRHTKVYIVEGYADVFTLHKHEVTNAVALCGLSFSEEKYKLLSNCGVQEIVFCLDNDEAGKAALDRIINKELKNLTGLNVLIKEIPAIVAIKDVDDFINKKGIEEFKKLEELDIFNWKFKQLKLKKEDSNLKDELLQIVIDEESFTKKDIHIQQLSELTGISVDAFKQEVVRLAKTTSASITSIEVFKEMNSLEYVVDEWDYKATSRTGELIGLRCNLFPVFTKKLDGIQNAYYFIDGDTNVGKSALLLNLSLDIVSSNEKVFVIYFSIDDSASQLLPRMVALKQRLEINAVSNPKYKIQHNSKLTEQESIDQLLRRNKGVSDLRKLSNKFAIKLEHQAKTIEEVERYIKIYKKIAGDKQLVVVLDNVHRMKTAKSGTKTEAMIAISDKLKEWKNVYDLPVIASGELRKPAVHGARPTMDDIKDCKEIQYDCDVGILLWTDLYNKGQKAILKFPTKDTSGNVIEAPIIEAHIAKNKTSAFKACIYYRFFTSSSLIEECSADQQREYFNNLNGIQG